MITFIRSRILIPAVVLGLSAAQIVPFASCKRSKPEQPKAAFQLGTPVSLPPDQIHRATPDARGRSASSPNGNLSAPSPDGNLSARPPGGKSGAAAGRATVRERRIRIAVPPFRGCPRGNEYVASQNGSLEKAVLNIVNRERTKLGLKKLQWDPRLALAARYHAADMATENYFSHDSQDRRDGGLVHACKTFERARKFAPHVGAENIAAGSSTAEGVMGQWMNSPGHKRNILSGAKYLGVGYYTDPAGGYRHYWVQNFGY